MRVELESEIFDLHDSKGVPLSYIAHAFLEKGLFWSWEKWMEVAVSRGWTYDRIKKTIFSINDEIYGKEWRKFKIAIPKLYLKIVDGNETQT